LLGVEEVGAPQVGVPLLVPAVDAADVDANGPARRGRVSRVDVELAGDAAEAATHGRESEVADGEGDARVTGVDGPLGQFRVLPSDAPAEVRVRRRCRLH